MTTDEQMRKHSYRFGVIASCRFCKGTGSLPRPDQQGGQWSQCPYCKGYGGVVREEKANG